MIGVSFDEVARATAAVEPRLRPAQKDRALRAMNQDDALSHGARRVFIAIWLAIYWKEGATAEIGQGTLAAELSLSRSTVARAITQLEDRGHIVVLRSRIAPTLHSPNRYALPGLAARNDDVTS